MEALNAAQAVIQFDLNGNVVDANENFLNATGYKKGESFKGEFKRLKGDGNEIWLEASYNPVHDHTGTLIGVVKFAIDITKTKMRNIDVEGQLKAISRSQAVIEFTLEGEILTANENFCDALGYKKSEIVGQKHKIFVDPQFAQSAEYESFWDVLRAGKYHSDEFLRYRKDGSPIWIQASYNPIFDTDGKILKVVKFAKDVTERKQVVSALAENLEKLASGDLTPRMPNSRSDFAQYHCDRKERKKGA